MARSKEALINSIIHQQLVFPDNVYEIVSKDCIDVITGVKYIYHDTNNIKLVLFTTIVIIIVAGQITFS